jgi:hypothetical protein
VYVDVDSTGDRARVKLRVTLKDLVRGKARDQELLLYWQRADSASPWFMELESSLRKGEAEAGKKH